MIGFDPRPDVAAYYAGRLREHGTTPRGRRRPHSHPPVPGEVIMVRVSVFYPNESGKKFDLDYYKKRHMGLVEERLRSFGLLRTEVDRGLAGGAPGAPAPFVCIGHVYFSSLEGFQKGMGAHGKEILGDVPNYTDIAPQIQISEIVS